MIIVVSPKNLIIKNVQMAIIIGLLAEGYMVYGTYWEKNRETAKEKVNIYATINAHFNFYKRFCFLKFSVEDVVEHRMRTETISKMNWNKNIIIVPWSTLSTIYSHLVMLDGVKRLTDHIIDLIRNINRNTLMRVLVLLSGSAPLIAHFNFSTRDAYVTKQNKLTARNII